MIKEFIEGAPAYLRNSFTPILGKVPLLPNFLAGVDSDTCLTTISRRGDGVGLLCGGISGIYCVDVDEQHYRGIAARVYEAFKETPFYNNSSVVIESTPSGGMHYWFRSPEVGKTTWLSARLNEEGKKETFIETRGEGSMFAAYPSPGYNLLTDWAYAEEPLTDVEAADLITFFRSFNEYVKPEVVRTPKRDHSKYETDPFSDFNARFEVIPLLESKGWTVEAASGTKTHLRRPGKKAGIGGTHFSDTNTFYCYTSSTELEPSELYNATGLVLAFGVYPDTKEMYKWIKEEYGQLTEYASKDFAERWLNRALLEYGDTGNLLPFPATLHPAVYTNTQKQILEALEGFKHGIFWDEENKIDRERLYRCCNLLGFRLNDGLLCRIAENPHCVEAGLRFVSYLSLTDLNRILKAYVSNGITEVFESTDTTVINSVDAFIEGHGKHLLDQLNSLERSDFINDTEGALYRFFKDCWVEVDSHNIHVRDYEDLYEGYISLDKYINFEYKKFSDGDKGSEYFGYFKDFLSKAVWDSDHALNCIAHLVHDYKSISNPYAVGLVESSSDPMRIGGSGKNLLLGLLGCFTSIHNMSAETIKSDDVSMMQSWNGQRVVSFNDLPKRFDFTTVRELISGNIEVKKLYRDIRTVSFFDSPKLAFNTNYGVPVMRGDLRRRIRVVEFTDFFNVSEGVACYYSNLNAGLPTDYMFPGGNRWGLNSDFTPAKHGRNCWQWGDWKQFFDMIFKAVSGYIKAGLVVNIEKATAAGWEKNFAHTYGESELTYMQERFSDLVGRTLPNQEVYTHYTDYCSETGVLPTYRKKDKAHVQALREWAQAHGVIIEENVSTGLGRRGKRFTMGVNKVMPTVNETNYNDDDGEFVPF